MELIVFIDSLCLYGLYHSIPVYKVQKSFITDLELALQNPLVFVRDQVCLTQCVFGSNPNWAALIKAPRNDIWVHSASLGVLLSAFSAILVNRSGVMTLGKALAISGSRALIMSAIDILLRSFICSVFPAFLANSFFTFPFF